MDRRSSLRARGAAIAPIVICFIDDRESRVLCSNRLTATIGATQLLVDERAMGVIKSLQAHPRSPSSSEVRLTHENHLEIHG